MNKFIEVTNTEVKAKKNINIVQEDIIFWENYTLPGIIQCFVDRVYALYEVGLLNKNQIQKLCGYPMRSTDTDIKLKVCQLLRVLQANCLHKYGLEKMNNDDLIQELLFWTAPEEGKIARWHLWEYLS